MKLQTSYKKGSEADCLVFNGETSLTLSESKPENNVLPGNSPRIKPILYTKDIETAQ